MGGAQADISDALLSRDYQITQIRAVKRPTEDVRRRQPSASEGERPQNETKPAETLILNF